MPRSFLVINHVVVMLVLETLIRPVINTVDRFYLFVFVHESGGKLEFILYKEASLHIFIIRDLIQ